MRKFTNLNERVVVTNLVGWDISWYNDVTRRDTFIPGYMKNFQLITLEEAQNEIAKGNPFFVGNDGHGSHAILLIEDPEVRAYILGTDVEPIQITSDRINAMLNAETKEDYVNAFEELIKNESEAREILHRWDF